MPTITEYLDTTGHAAGLVTRVTLQAKQTHRVSVFIDDEFAFGLDGEVAVRHGLKQGARVDATVLRAVARDDQIASCKRVAIRFLSYRMRSTDELRKRLKSEGASLDVITSVLQQLKEAGLIDDAAFAKAYARDALVARKWGPHRIARGLRQAGINTEHSAEALNEVRTMLDDEDVVLTLARKRWNQLSSVVDIRKRRKRLYDYLARRGFDFDDVRRVLDEVARP